MFEFHGWITIHETPSEVDSGKLEEIVNKIKLKIEELAWESNLLKLYAVNGSHRLCIDGYTNHKSNEAKDIITLVEFVADLASGSYGILYIRDDEDINGLDNEFIVYVLARGNITEKKDPFLSPFIPNVESEDI
jgi:hypothetical protein